MSSSNAIHQAWPMANWIIGSVVALAHLGFLARALQCDQRSASPDRG
jgi:hypothetical protein